ncbi:MAG: hypothetical protein UHN47_18175 [Lachnospiraceae bacterium]|nr:hypothetical protein [Lachnospiraceae bacterium]
MGISIVNNYNNIPIVYTGSVKEDTNCNGTESLYFNINEMGIKPKSTPSFVSRVLSRDELKADWRGKVEKNQYKKKSLYDMFMASCKEGTGAKFKFVGEEKVYNFYEYISEIEKRTRANMAYADLTEEKKEQLKPEEISEEMIDKLLFDAGEKSIA